MRDSTSYVAGYQTEFEATQAATEAKDFRRSYSGICLSSSLRLDVKTSFDKLVGIMTQAFRNTCPYETPKVVGYNSRTVSVSTESAFLMLNEYRGWNSDFWTVYDRTVDFTIYGDPVIIKQIMDILKRDIDTSRQLRLEWKYMNSGCMDSRQVNIAKPKPIHREFYPWIKEDINEYFDRFFKSEATVMILLGQAGTAKTSFVRSMIWHQNVDTILTFDEGILASDNLYLNYLTDDNSGLLVVEDADLLLSSREKDGNRTMAKILNVGDGLVAIPKKKMVFTANITEPSKIDSALLRVGRCFDCQIFRPLTYKEACAAAEVAGIPIPVKDRSYTLAELFAYANGEARPEPGIKFGFGA